MYGNPQQGYMPDFKPDDQAISKPSPDTPSGDGFLLSELPVAAAALIDRITCEGCE